jgi:hypothetical protein
VGKIEVEEQYFLYRKRRGIDKRCIAPLRSKIGVMNRSYSRRCQKLMTDFGIEESFSGAAVRMKEHHGVSINVSAIRRVTEMHAERAQDVTMAFEQEKRLVKQMILEMDGEMVPLVKYGKGTDRRKDKTFLWAELRVGATQRNGEVDWKYATSFSSAEQLGDKMRITMEKMGMNEQTKVHGVGDGAAWIPEQGERIAGSKYTHLIDLYHLCEYLAKAVENWAADPKVEVMRLKKRFENGDGEKVLKILKRQQKKLPQHEGLRICIQYIENRPGQFEYKKAKQLGLPMGSGKIESTHRSLIQKRLKKPGAWWRRENAAKMAELRVARANNCWGHLWQQDLRSPCQAKIA